MREIVRLGGEDGAGAEGMRFGGSKPTQAELGWGTRFVVGELKFKGGPPATRPRRERKELTGGPPARRRRFRGEKRDRKSLKIPGPQRRGTGGPLLNHGAFEIGATRQRREGWGTRGFVWGKWGPPAIESRLRMRK